MTTGPRPTPYPIVLHVDQNGNPVRLAEASAIYATNVSAVTIIATTVSASQYEGLESLDGFPGGSIYSVQYKGSDNNFAGEPQLTYNPTTNTLEAQVISVVNLSAISETILNIVRSNNLSSTSLASINLDSEDARIIFLSATTVCATNYDSQFAALSFQNLDLRYLNSSGDSVTGSFYLQNLNASTLSSTAYFNLPSATAIWNASGLVGFPISSVTPGLYEVLTYNGSHWVPSSTGGVGGGTPGGPSLSLQFKNGAIFSGVNSITYNTTLNALSSTNLIGASAFVNTISATSYYNLGEDSPIWNAKKINSADVVKKQTITAGDILVWNNTAGGFWESLTPAEYANFSYPVILGRLPSSWNASSIRGVPVTSTPPTTNDILVYTGSHWAPSATISLATISATNLGGSNIVGTRANVTNISATVVSATTLSAVSARVTGLSAVTLSASNYLGLPVSSLSSLLDVSTNAVLAGQALVYSQSISKWAPGYRIYQENSQPNASIGANGDIYFQILDSTGTALSSLVDVSITTVNGGQALIWNNSISKWQPGTVGGATGNASSILGRTVIQPATPVFAPNITSSFGPLLYVYGAGEYQTVGFNSVVLNGTRDIVDNGGSDLDPQGVITASYLGSASEYFQVNPYWNSSSLTLLPTTEPVIFGGIDYPGYPDLPEEKDILTFTDNLYNKALSPIAGFLQTKAWTWKRLTVSGGYLRDVQASSPSANNVLMFDGAKWVNSTLSSINATTLYSASADLSSVKLTKYYEAKTQPTITTSALTLNLNNSQIFDITLTSNVSSITIQNPVNANETAQGFTLAITYDSTSRTITWPTEIKWPGGSAPILTNSNNKIDIFSFITLNKGISWLGFISGQNYTA